MRAGGEITVWEQRRKVTALISVLLVIIMAMAATELGFPAKKGAVQVLYSHGMRLYGLNSSTLSEYNIVVNVTGNITLRGTWSSPWHILADLGLNAILQGNSTSITNAICIVNRTGPQMAFFLGFPPKPASLPTNGSFSITVTFHNRSSFRMSGWYTSVNNGAVSLNESALLPLIAMKYGLLLSFAFIYPAENVQPPPYLAINQNFETISN
ncbi:MAG: hypothetical protein KIS30_04355 [Thermoplasmata archaeon]|nr:hypothetical protein [Candidatus Sysuiplasma acidicola]MBX8645975.1 hypothetical protein [Candidatus Sysuiplasma acidicola]